MTTPAAHRRPDAAADAADRTAIVLRPIASPMPLGFLAFGVGMALTSLQSLTVLPVADAHQVATLLLTFTGPLQLIAAVFAFLARDVGAGTTFAVFAMTWVSTGVTLLGAPPGTTSPVTAAFFSALVALVAVLGVGARSVKPALTALLTLAGLRFAVTALFDATGRHGWDLASGWVGAVIAVASLYGGLALLLEDAQGHTVLPTGRRGRARESFEAGVGSQLSGLESEAGVRRQL